MSHPAGSTAPGTTRRRTPGWLWLLAALVVLALLLLALSQCGADDPPSAAGGAGTSAPAQDPSLAPQPPPGGDAAGTALTVGDRPLLPLSGIAGPNGELTELVGQTVAARGATVLSVPADEGFWVGTSETDRVWVRLSGPDESGYVVTQGDRVDFTGTIQAHDASFAGQVGVDPAEGADQLNRQGAHIEVAKPDLQPSTG
jgi:hypothetical protein